MRSKEWEVTVSKVRARSTQSSLNRSDKLDGVIAQTNSGSFKRNHPLITIVTITRTWSMSMCKDTWLLTIALETTEVRPCEKSFEIISTRSPHGANWSVEDWTSCQLRPKSDDCSSSHQAQKRPSKWLIRFSNVKSSTTRRRAKTNWWTWAISQKIQRNFSLKIGARLVWNQLIYRHRRSQMSVQLSTRTHRSTNQQPVNSSSLSGNLSSQRLVACGNCKMSTCIKTYYLWNLARVCPNSSSNRATHPANHLNYPPKKWSLAAKESLLTLGLISRLSSLAWLSGCREI